MGRLSENSVLVTKNKSHAITANLTVHDGGAEGVIIAQGGAFAGWCIYAKDGRAKYCYNLLGLKRFVIESDRALPTGDHQVRVEFDYDGGGLAKGATVALYVDGDKVGDGRLDATVPMLFSGDETTDVGRDGGTGVSDEYLPGKNEFSGTVHWVQIDIDDKAEDFDHLITPEERWHIAMARQ
jgi:arylsulfatase